MTEVIEKIDFTKTMKSLWRPPAGKFSIVEVPPMQFAMIDGTGDPSASQAFAGALQWLYSVSYTIKFMSKAMGHDYVVPPPEGLWWTEDPRDFAAGRKDRWQWTAMIMQPEWITPDLFRSAVEKTVGKLGAAPASLRLAPFAEGLSVQILHVGPYSAEGPVIERLHHDFLPANGLVENGRHHELYLYDPGRTAPEKLRTVIRQPVKHAAPGS